MSASVGGSSPTTRYEAHLLGLCVECWAAPADAGLPRCRGCEKRPPADSAAAYRRGPCVSCLLAPKALARIRCEPCHVDHVSSGGRALTGAGRTGRGMRS